MELIHSAENSYQIIEVLYHSHRCRVSLGRDNEGGLFLLNRVSDKPLITRFLERFDETLPDFCESFIFEGALFAVFAYHQGIPVGENLPKNHPSALLSLLEKLAMAAAMEDLPTDFLCQTLSLPCMTETDGTVRINKLLTFPEEEPSPEYAVQKLSALLCQVIRDAELDPLQQTTLTPLQKQLDAPPKDLLTLYLAVRDFRAEYQPMDTKEILKAKWEPVRTTTTKVRDTVLFYGALAAMLLAAVLAFWILLHPPEPEPSPLPEIGGYSLDERGSIDETLLSDAETPETDNN